MGEVLDLQSPFLETDYLDLQGPYYHCLFRRLFVGKLRGLVILLGQ